MHHTGAQRQTSSLQPQLEQSHQPPEPTRAHLQHKKRQHLLDRGRNLYKILHLKLSFTLTRWLSRGVNQQEAGTQEVRALKRMPHAENQATTWSAGYSMIPRPPGVSSAASITGSSSSETMCAVTYCISLSAATWSLPAALTSVVGALVGSL